MIYSGNIDQTFASDFWPPLSRSQYTRFESLGCHEIIWNPSFGSDLVDFGGILIFNHPQIEGEEGIAARQEIPRCYPLICSFRSTMGELKSLSFALKVRHGQLCDFHLHKDLEHSTAVRQLTIPLSLAVADLHEMRVWGKPGWSSNDWMDALRQNLILFQNSSKRQWVSRQVKGLQLISTPTH